MKFHLSALLVTLISIGAYSQTVFDPNAITIARDKWGTPHIFAKTDAEVAFGLAWANAEDNFFEIQETLISGKGMMGRVKGVEGAKIDFFVSSIKAPENALDALSKISPQYLKYLEGYCEGLNAFARAFPAKVRLKKAFPVKPVDVLQSYYVVNAVLADASWNVADAVGENADKREPTGIGSNAYAMSPIKTEDGSTMLCGNPHFAIGQPFAFYEAHLCSEEGLNIVGSFFHGSNSMAIGTNEHLGWTHTFNYFDRADVFKLKMNPCNKRKYEVDGKWHKLEVRRNKLKVKLGGVVLSVGKRSYFSMFGPTFKSKNGNYYAVNCVSFGANLSGEQVYKMNKAKNWAEFKSALEMQQLPLFNLVYADKEDNIFYLSNGRYPKRVNGPNWAGVVDASDSKVLWKDIYTIDSLPQSMNPKSGFLFNTNHNPNHCSDVVDSSICKLPSWANLRPGENNRSIRFIERLENIEKVSYEAFKDIKFDSIFSPDCSIRKAIAQYKDLDFAQNPDMIAEHKLMQAWDWRVNDNSVEATLVGLTLDYVFKKYNYSDDRMVSGIPMKPQDYKDGLYFACDFLRKNYQKTLVPYHQVFKHFKDGKYYDVKGFPDLLLASYFEKHEQGKYRIVFGDSYIIYTRFKDGKLAGIESLSPFGPSVDNSNYQSQLEMYRRKELKPMTLDKQKVLTEAIKVYKPRVGE